MKIAILLTLVAVTWAGVPRRQQYIDGEHFIGLKPGSDVTKFLARYTNVHMKKVYEFPRTTLLFVEAKEIDIERLKNSPEVKYVERNGVAWIDQCSSGSANGCWGLDRIDQTGQLGYSSPTDPSAVYTWGEDTGASVDAWVLDTGIYIGHNDFDGRAVFAFTATGLDPTDDNGHGTHCAGTIGSTSYGVAKGSTLQACKVMRDAGFGSYDDIIDGINWVIDNHDPARGNVASMSIGGGPSQPFDDAIAAMVTAGITSVVAAGNNGDDACDYSPSREPSAITVAASDVSDNLASFSNWGTCVDIIAPGVDVNSCWIGNPDATNVISGTSMACPHTAGVVARYLSSNLGATPADVVAWLTGAATPNAIGNLPSGTPDLLLFGGCPI